MLVIRREQIKALSWKMRKAFEGRMVLHLKEFFPDQCEMLGEEDTRAAIRYGMGRAEGYGLETEGDIAKYLNLMFVFGRTFDTDPDLPWASEILNARADYAPSERMARLYEVAMGNESEGQGFFARVEDDSSNKENLEDFKGQAAQKTEDGKHDSTWSE
jgi:hypothetical protein